MTKHLEETRDDLSKLPMVRAAAHKGYKILQKYYWHTDDTPFYRVAMCKSCLNLTSKMRTLTLCQVLHPNYKKKYFTRARWPNAWVQEALQLLRAEWNEHYRHSAPSLGDDAGEGLDGQHTVPRTTSTSGQHTAAVSNS